MKNQYNPLWVRTLAALLSVVLATCALTACDDGTGRRPKETDGSSAASKRETESVTETETETETSVQVSDDYSDWIVSEHVSDGIKETQIQNSGRHGRQSEMDFLCFKVYETEENAKQAYAKYYDKSKSFDKGHWEEGDNWFISDEWGVTDVSIVWMVYLEGNILIITDLAVNGRWIVYGDDTSDTEPEESSFKGFVLNNIPEIVRFVNEELLENL